MGHFPVVAAASLAAHWAASSALLLRCCCCCFGARCTAVAVAAKSPYLQHWQTLLALSVAATVRGSVSVAAAAATGSAAMCVLPYQRGCATQEAEPPQLVAFASFDHLWRRGAP